MPTRVLPGIAARVRRRKARVNEDGDWADIDWADIDWADIERDLGYEPEDEE
ncbi:MAG: hypothetical protein JO138_02825 [Acidobacteriaceae bacterium]|nr:hypothetical protein [Acidobacteriaceae bacterium]